MRNWWGRIFFPLLASLFPRYTKRIRGKSNTQPVCGEHKIKSISSLHHLESRLVHARKASPPFLAFTIVVCASKLSYYRWVQWTEMFSVVLRWVTVKGSFSQIGNKGIFILRQGRGIEEFCGREWKSESVRQRGKQCDITSLFRRARQRMWGREKVTMMDELYVVPAVHVVKGMRNTTGAFSRLHHNRDSPWKASQSFKLLSPSEKSIRTTQQPIRLRKWTVKSKCDWKLESFWWGNKRL